MEKFREFNIDGTQLEKKELNESRMEMMNLFDTEDFDDEENNDGNYFDKFMEYVNDRCMDKENVENKDLYNKRIIIYK